MDYIEKMKDYEKVIKKFSEVGIVPVIKLEQVEKAGKLADALIRGGVYVAEVTFRADGAEKVIQTLRKNYDKILTGAGTVLSLNQAKQAKAAGAQFIVSPGFNPEVVEFCLEEDLPVFPGCVTPTEIERALGYGLNVLKFFPAEQFGGVKAIKALSAPYGNVRFMPTGGITLDNLQTYCANSAVLACGGSFMVKQEFFKNDSWQDVTDLCEKAIKIVKEARK